MVTAEAVKSHLDFQQFFSAELGDLKLGNNGNALARCPFHEDKRASFSLNLRTGLWHCFAWRAAGDVIDFYMRRHGVDFPTACRNWPAWPV